MRRGPLLFWSLVAGVAGASAGQAQSPAQAAPQGMCELHIWPAYNFDARSQGLGAITGVLGTIDDDNAHADRNSGDKARLAAYLAPEVQVATLKTMGLERYFGQALTFQFHDKIEHDQSAKTGTYSKKRSVESTATCYDELFITYIRYDRSPFYPATISFGVNIKTFDASTAKPKKDVFETGKIKAKGFSSTVPIAETGPAREVVVSSFRDQLSATLTKMAAKLKK